MMEVLKELTDEEASALLHDWELWARPNQIIPQSGDWTTCLVLAGRGFGKTRMGTEEIRAAVRRGKRRIAILAETAADARDVLVEGQSGILAISPKDERPLYEPSKRRLTWPNGAIGTLYNGTEPDQLRGPEHDYALVDELAKYRYAQDTWDMLQFGMRLGKQPRVVVTTTPKPIPLIRELVKDPDTLLIRGSTFDNALNLPGRFLKTIRKRYEGTRIGRQELDAELLLDVPGALWTADMFLPIRDPQGFSRVVVAVDPSGTSGEDEGKSNMVGIVVAAKYIAEDRYVILDDATCDLGPAGWGRRAVEMYKRYSADRIVAEANFGGAMVKSTIQATDRNVPVRMVTASRGKVVRAEPVSALYEQKRVDHAVWTDRKKREASGLELLEAQMQEMTSNGYVGDGSPDRVDAAVWAISDLLSKEAGSTKSTRVRGLI